MTLVITDQGNANDPTNDSVLELTTVSDIDIHSSIVVLVGRHAGVPLITLTDTAGNTYANVVGEAATESVNIWYCGDTVSTPAGTVITANWGGTATTAKYIQVYSINGTSVPGTTGGAQTVSFASSATASTSGSVTAGNYVFACVAGAPTAATWIQASGWTGDFHAFFGTAPGGSQQGAAGYKLSTGGIETYHPTMASNPFIAWAIVLAEFTITETVPPPPPIVPGIFFAEEKDTTYHDWRTYLGTGGCDFDSYFISGFKIHGEMKNFSPMYVYFTSKQEDNSSWFMRTIFDYATNDTTHRWSLAQQGYRATPSRSWTISRLKARGNGPVLQFKIYSEEGKPFNIAGWTSFETVDGLP